MSNYTSVYSALQSNLPFVVAGMGIVMLIALIMLLVQWSRLRGIRRRFECLLGAGGGNEGLEDMILANQRTLRGTLERFEVLAEDLETVKGKMAKNLQQLGLVRFNAFPDAGGDLSFAVALLDETGNGIVLTSLYGREEARVFAKPVVAGISSYQLSREEAKAIAVAISREIEGKKCQNEGRMQEIGPI